VAESFLRRNDVGYPQQANPRAIYAVKHFQDADPEVLQDIVNTYLLNLPALALQWVPHVVDVKFYYTGTGGNARHHCWIELYATGTIDAPPIG